MNHKHLQFLALTVWMTFVAFNAQAGLIRITEQGETPPETVITEPVPIIGDGFRVTYHGGGHTELIDPILLLIGIPSDTVGGTAPTLTFSGSSSTPFTLSINLGSTAWGSTAASGSGGLFNEFSPVNDVYELIGVDLDSSGGSDSHNWTNWSGAAAAADSWEIFVYELIFDPDFAREDWIEIGAILPQDSLIAGYGCLTEDATGECSSIEGTPFTFAGHITTASVASVAAPAALPLLLLGLLGAPRRRRA